MGRNNVNFVTIVLVSMSFIAGAHVFKDYKNKELVLTSVYDAMKENLQQEIRQNLNRNDVLHDSRNKRNTNTNEKLETYYDNQPSDSNNEWAVVNAPTFPASDLVCTRRGDHSQTRITVSDHHNAAATGITIALIVKWALAVIAALALPVILFKAFILPFKILLGLKAITLLNSFLLGSLLLKYKFSKPFYPGLPIAGTIPASASSASSASASSAAATSHSLELSDETADYVDVVRPSEDLRRILKYVNKRQW